MRERTVRPNKVSRPEAANAIVVGSRTAPNATLSMSSPTAAGVVSVIVIWEMRSEVETTPKNVAVGLRTRGSDPSRLLAPNTFTLTGPGLERAKRSNPTALTVGAKSRTRSSTKRNGPTTSEGAPREPCVTSTSIVPGETLRLIPGSILPGANAMLFDVLLSGSWKLVTVLFGRRLFSNVSTGRPGSAELKAVRLLKMISVARAAGVRTPKIVAVRMISVNTRRLIIHHLLECKTILPTHHIRFAVLLVLAQSS